MNIIQIIGNLGKDPETRYTPSGQKVTNLVIASNSKRGGKEETTWWRVTLWGDKFDKMLSYLKKGSFVMCIGEMHRPEIFTNREGQSQVSLEMTAEALRFVPGRSDRKDQEGGSNAQSGHEPVQEPVMAGQGHFEDSADLGAEEESLPF